MKLNELRIPVCNKGEGKYRKYLIVNVFKFKNGSYKVHVVCSDNNYFLFNHIDIPRKIVKEVDIEDGYLVVPVSIDVHYYPGNYNMPTTSVYLDFV